MDICSSGGSSFGHISDPDEEKNPEELEQGPHRFWRPIVERMGMDGNIIGQELRGL